MGLIMVMQLHAMAHGKTVNNKEVRVVYTNWRGETAERVIQPIEIYWGKTEWHPEEQWLLKVWDVDRAAERCYAMKDIKEWR